jgi:hypothetical protein
MLKVKQTGASDSEVAREAKRIFRQMAQPNAHLAAVSADWYALHHGARMERRVQKVAAVVVDRFLRNGWLSRGATRETFVLSQAGIGWLARSESGEADPFLAQHQIRSVRRIDDPDGVKRDVVVNEAEDPLGVLLHRGFVTRVQYDAGEKLRRDYTVAKLAPRLGMDLSSPVVLKSRSPVSLVPDVAIAAGQRFRAGMRALGPGLSDVAFDICCDLKGLEDAERERDWPRRSAKVVLGLALDRLAEHYGIAVTAPARGVVRSWTSEEGA